MAEVEWSEPECLTKVIAMAEGITYFDGDDAVKYGKWRLEMNENLSATLYSGSTFFSATLSYLSSCTMKILTTSDWAINYGLGVHSDNLLDQDEIIGGQNPHHVASFRLTSFGSPSVTLKIEFRKSRSCQCSVCLSVNIPQITSNHSTAFENLLQSADSSDVVFEVGGVHIPAHKIILSARYEYFRALFSSGMKESNSSRVEVKDMDAQLFKEVLRFIYTGRLPNDLMSKGAAYLPISDFYGMDDLKLACSNALGKTLTADNVEEALILARAHHCPGLSTACSDAMKGLIGTENVINYLLTASQYELSDLKEECLRKCREYKGQNTLKRQTIELLKDHPELLWETFAALTD